MKSIRQYSGRLTVAQIAAGMNHCRSNAERLLASAKALYAVGDYALVASLAVLAIEEAGKVAILRRMVTALDEQDVKECWKEFRSHCWKNGLAHVPVCVKPNLRLEDFNIAVGKNKENNRIDDLKQIGFYVDCVGNADWMSPMAAIPEPVAAKVLAIAGIVCKSDRPITVRELELWKETVGSCPHGTMLEMKEKLVLWRHRMEGEGLKKPDPGFEKFVMGGLEVSDIVGHEIPDCALSRMRNELSVDKIWELICCLGKQE